MQSDAPAPVLVHVVRDGFVESVHRGCVAVATADGTVLVGLGDPDIETYPRSALKPFQAVATLGLLAESAQQLPSESVAIATASHDGSDAHQIEAAYVLAQAGLDEDALRCPPAFAADEAARAAQGGFASRLAHNCSGKHAAFLFAQACAGDDPVRYLERDSAIQQRVEQTLTLLCGGQLFGPGVDGCGAPAWRMPLDALAAAFARLADGQGPLRPIRDAMSAHPELIGGALAADTRLMTADPRVVAKRGAEAVMGAAFDGPEGAVGVAVKISDGSPRAAAVVVAAAMQVLGAIVQDDLLRPAVLGGGRPHGHLVVPPPIGVALTAGLR